MYIMVYTTPCIGNQAFGNAAAGVPEGLSLVHWEYPDLEKVILPMAVAKLGPFPILPPPLAKFDSSRKLPQPAAKLAGGMHLSS
jgi:hypothetical protein